MFARAFVLRCPELFFSHLFCFLNVYIYICISTYACLCLYKKSSIIVTKYLQIVAFLGDTNIGNKTSIVFLFNFLVSLQKCPNAKHVENLYFVFLLVSSVRSTFVPHICSRRFMDVELKLEMLLREKLMLPRELSIKQGNILGVKMPERHCTRELKKEKQREGRRHRRKNKQLCIYFLSQKLRCYSVVTLVLIFLACPHLLCMYHSLKFPCRAYECGNDGLSDVYSFGNTNLKIIIIISRENKEM